MANLSLIRSAKKMPSRAKENSLVSRLLANRKLTASGIRAEVVGRRDVKISQNGRFVGVWRQAIGSYDWYPAGQQSPSMRVPTKDDVLDRTFHQFCG
jgi:hypothetical protein